MTPELNAAFEASNTLEALISDSDPGGVDFDILIDAAVDKDGNPYVLVTTDKDLSGVLPMEMTIGKRKVGVHSCSQKVMQ